MIKPLIALLFLGTPSFLLASEKNHNSPSFDCRAAKSKVEKAICDDAVFSSYDVLLSKTYSQKKSDPTFAKSYQSWTKDRNACNYANDDHNLKVCLRNQYALVFGLLFERFDGPSEPLIPSKECLFPLIGHMNGDQGFYSVRLISSIRGCDNLNLNVSQSTNLATITFVNKEGNIYYYRYQIEDSFDEVGVSFSLRHVSRSIGKRKVKEPTLVMTIESQ